MKRRIDVIPTSVMKVLSEYHRPGNIRELENLMERAVILSDDSELRPPLAELSKQKEPSAPLIGSASYPTTLAEAKREHILRALEATGWVMGGTDGAAARLGMKRTTLQYRMKKLGVVRSN